LEDHAEVAGRAVARTAVGEKAGQHAEEEGTERRVLTGEWATTGAVADILARAAEARLAAAPAAGGDAVLRRVGCTGGSEAAEMPLDATAVRWAAVGTGCTWGWDPCPCGARPTDCEGHCHHRQRRRDPAFRHHSSPVSTLMSRVRGAVPPCGYA